MKNSTNVTNFSTLLNSIAITLLFLTEVRITANPQDTKLLIFFLYSTVLLLKFNFKTEEKLFDIKIFIPLILLLTYVFLNWIFLSLPYYGNKGIVFFWQTLLSFIIGVLFLSKDKTLVMVLPIFIATVTVMSIVGILQYFGFFFVYSEYFPTQILPFVNARVYFAFIVMVSVIWTIHQIFNTYQKLLFTLYIISVLLQLTALFFAESRAVTLLIAVGVVLEIVYQLKANSKFMNGAKNRSLVYLAMGAVLLIAVVMWSDHFWYKIALVIYEPPLHPKTRNVFYAAQIKEFLSRPFFGGGLGNFISFNINYWPDAFRRIVRSFSIPRNGHSDYLETLSELGIVGAIITYYFWVLALTKMRVLRKNYNPVLFTKLLTFFLMAVHATVSTSTKNFPMSMMLWATIGSLCAEPTPQKVTLIHTKIRKYVTLFFSAIHILIFALFLQVFIADTLYCMSKSKSGSTVKIKRLRNVLKVCPCHPDALAQLAYIAAKHNAYDFAIDCADELDKIAPNIKPTDFIRAYSRYMQQDYDSAYIYVNRQLKQTPLYYEAVLLKGKTLAALRRCDELAVLKKEHPPVQITFNPFKDTLTTESFKDMEKMAGKQRVLVNKKGMKKMYICYLKTTYNQAKIANDSYRELNKIECK